MTQNDLLRLIIAKGVLAPSADNLQPWKFKLGENRIDLFLDPERVTNFCDEGLLAPYISAGAVIENIRVAAQHAGEQLILHYFPDARERYWVARLEFKAGVKNSEPDLRALDWRVTNRKFYLKHAKIRDRAYDHLRRTVGSEDGLKIYFVERDEPDYRKLTRLIGNADQVRFESRRLHRELMSIIRMDAVSAAATRDGLDLRTLEAGPGAKFNFQLMSSWRRMEILNKLGMSVLFNLYARLQMKSSSAAGLIVTPTSGPQDYVRGGEVMQRMWHEAAIEGLALQPMEALPIFIMNLRLNGGKDFSESQKETLKKLRDEFYALFHINDENGLILLFRLGYADPVSVRSLRRPVDTFIVP